MLTGWLFALSPWTVPQDTWLQRWLVPFKKSFFFRENTSQFRCRVIFTSPACLNMLISTLRMLEIHEKALRNLEMAFSSRRFWKTESVFSADASAFVCQRYHFDILTAVSLGFDSIFPISPLWARPNAQGRPHQSTPVSGEGHDSCVWPSVLARCTNWLISLPHGAHSGQAGEYGKR